VLEAFIGNETYFSGGIIVFFMRWKVIILSLLEYVKKLFFVVFGA